MAFRTVITRSINIILFLISFHHSSTFLTMSSTAVHYTDYNQLNHSYTISGSNRLFNKSNNLFLSHQRLKCSHLLTTSDQIAIPETVLIALGQIENANQLSNILSDNSSINQEENKLQPEGHTRRLRSIRRAKSTSLNLVPSECSPENRTEFIPPPDDKYERYFPGCVKVPKCSGCCMSSRLACLPIKMSDIVVEVSILRFNRDLGRFKFSGRKQFTFKRHDKCKCDCIQKKGDCSPNHDYKKEECRCVCSDYKAAQTCGLDNLKRWDSDKCQCNCIKVNHCSSGFHFDNQTCSCTISPTNRPWLNDQSNMNSQSSSEVILSSSSPSPFWNKPSGSRLPTNEHENESDQITKIHQSIGFQGINPSSSKRYD